MSALRVLGEDVVVGLHELCGACIRVCCTRGQTGALYRSCHFYAKMYLFSTPTATVARVIAGTARSSLLSALAAVDLVCRSGHNFHTVLLVRKHMHHDHGTNAH